MISENSLKEMLLSLSNTIHNNFQNMLQQFKQDIQGVGDRVSHIENKMDEFAGVFNELVDSHNDREDDIIWIKSKLADLEDRSRRNNIKIRGIPETISQDELMQYVLDLFHELLPEASPLQLSIDRIHRIPKPSHLPDSLPRVTLLRIHFFSTKEQIMKAVRSTSLSTRFSKLQLYADLSQVTLALRRKLLPVTKSLRSHSITYKWGFPLKLIISKDDTTYTITSLEQGMALLNQWDIQPQAITPRKTKNIPDKSNNDELLSARKRKSHLFK